MKIVLLADNRKTELLVNFCIAYRSLLEKHQLISVYNTAKLIRSAVDLDISGLSVDYESGSEQLASRAGFNEIDAVIYLRDGRVSQLDRAKDLLDVCDVNNIPYSTNIAMAEILILAIDRGDLDYREWAREDKAEEA
jgi:methylglyoxal synthase